MADSKEKNPKHSTDFADDLDSMLDDAAASMNDSDELMDDDEAIDQLLMDNSLDAKDQSDEEDDELDELFTEDSVSPEIDDEFGPEIEPTLREEQAETEKIETDSQSTVPEIDEFAEIDEFSDFDEFDDDPQSAATPSEPDNSDFTVAEFDISYDDSHLENADSIVNQHESSSADSDEVAGSLTEKSFTPPPNEPAESSSIDMDAAAIAVQISQLFNGQAALKQQLEEVSRAADADQGDDLERLIKAQFALKKQFDERLGKFPIIANAALGLAVVALIIAGIFGYFAWDTSHEMEGLAQRMVIMEENQEAIIVKNNDKEINEINAKIDQQNQTLAELGVQLSSLTGEGSNQIGSALNAELSTAINQQKKLNDSIAALDGRIKRLETKVSSTKLQKTINKPAGKTARSKYWSVNLVSFRQEWYANRKAEEFTQKGVPTEVVAVNVKGEPWYRLTVKGFKTKAEASAYAAQVKKNFNLDSVWLGKD